MAYRFVRMIGSGLAEVTTPQGRTIRLPVPSGSNFKANQIVQPEFNTCCQPTGLVLPGVGSGGLKPFKDVLQPRRVAQSTNKTATGVIFINSYLSTRFSENTFAFWMEGQANGDGSVTRAGLEKTAAKLVAIPNSLFFSRQPRVNTMPSETVLMIDATGISGWYDLIATTSQGVVGYWRTGGDEIKQEVITATPNPLFPELSEDVSTQIDTQEIRVRDIYRILVAFSFPQSTGTVELSEGSSSYTGQSPLTVSAQGYNKKTYGYTNGLDPYYRDIQNQLKALNSDITIRVHSLAIGGRISGSFSSFERSSGLYDHRGEAEPENETYSYTESFPNYSYSDSGLSKLLPALRQPDPRKWVTVEVSKDKATWDNFELVGSDPFFERQVYENNQTSTGATVHDYTWRTYLANLYDSRVTQLAQKIYVI